MNKEFVAWLCGLISSDGNIGCYYLVDSRNQKKYHGGNVTIFTSEGNWAKQITSVLEANGLSCHLIECHTERPLTTDGRHRTEFRIDIYKYRPKQNRNDANQWQEIVDAILEYDFIGLIIPRKWQTLQEIARLGNNKR
jgi:hypothetical protein